MTRYEEDENGVTVHFDDGRPSVHAKILIGADGYLSRVRKQCLNDEPPMFAVRTLSSSRDLCILFAPVTPPPASLSSILSSSITPCQ